MVIKRNVNSVFYLHWNDLETNVCTTIGLLKIVNDDDNQIS